MALAAFPHKDSPGPQGTRRRLVFLVPAAWLAVFFGLGALLVLLPDGVAESLQTALAWLMVGMVAALAVSLVAKGLERLLDCDNS
jgi:Mn2+/Fe2+ NRAMP family transporter